MTYIISYQKFTDSLRTVEIRRPLIDGEFVGTELATVDGTTYIAMPDGVTLSSDQPEEISTSIVNPAALDSELRAAIKSASPHCSLISARMIDQIRGAYSIDEEMYFARIGVGAATGLYSPTSDEMQELTVFVEFVEAVREWGRGEREKLGLGTE